MTYFDYFLRQQVEADGVVAHHRLRHRRDHARQRFDGSRAVDADAVMIGAETLRDQIGIAELVALDVADGLEADGEGLQSVLSKPGEDRDQKRAVEPARKQHADRHVGDAAALDRFAERHANRLAPIRFGEGAISVRGPTSSCQ